MDDPPEPLWQVVVVDKEPWRKGRLFLVGFALLSALGDLLISGQFILSGLLVPVLIYGASRVLFWSQFYFIWIEVHWVRWLLAALQIFYGLHFHLGASRKAPAACCWPGFFSSAPGSFSA